MGRLERAKRGLASVVQLDNPEANELASDVIDRMPVILHPKDHARWLDREDKRPPLDLLRPFESDAMVKWPCDPLVGNSRNNGPEMLNAPA
jgi:putative SOS response-associated peptidase YedK